MHKRGDTIALNSIVPPRPSSEPWVVEPTKCRGRRDREVAVFEDRLHPRLDTTPDRACSILKRSELFDLSHPGRAGNQLGLLADSPAHVTPHFHLHLDIRHRIRGLAVRPLLGR